MNLVCDAMYFGRYRLGTSYVASRPRRH